MENVNDAIGISKIINQLGRLNSHTTKAKS